MILSFTLSMPRTGSWDGKWSGDGRIYVIVRNLGSAQTNVVKAHKLVAHGSFEYSFGDGWWARVNVAAVDAKEAAKLRKKSVGFADYDWMVDSIIEYGVIKPS